MRDNVPVLWEAFSAVPRDVVAVPCTAGVRSAAILRGSSSAQRGWTGAFLVMTMAMAMAAALLPAMVFLLYQLVARCSG